MDKEQFQINLEKLEKEYRNRFQSKLDKNHNMIEYDYENNSRMKLEYEKQLNVNLIPIALVSSMYLYYKSSVIDKYDIVLLILMLFIIKAISLQFKIYKANLTLNYIRERENELNTQYDIGIALFESQRNQMIKKIVEKNIENIDYKSKINELIEYTNQVYREYIALELSEVLIKLENKIINLGRFISYLDILILTLFITIGIVALNIFIKSIEYNSYLNILIIAGVIFILGVIIENLLYKIDKKK